jgi:hypothetical protein
MTTLLLTLILSPEASGGSSTSVSAHVTCSTKVRVFRGSKSGSGTYGWEEPNHSVSYTLGADEQLCVCDGSDKRLATPSGQSHVNVDIDCGGISLR